MILLYGYGAGVLIGLVIVLAVTWIVTRRSRRRGPGGDAR
jgi:hypothetical protein